MPPKAANHAETVKALYAAFQRGDVAAIVAQAADDVDWDNRAMGPMPWHGNFSGKAKLPGFFEAIAKHTDIPVFEPKEFVSEGPYVVVRLHLRIVMKKNAKKAEFDAIHFWTFDAQGKVRAYRHYNDTALEQAAWKG